MLHPLLAVSCVLSEARDELRIFAVNRELRDEVELELIVAGLAAVPLTGRPTDGAAPLRLAEVLEWVELWADKLSAANTEQEPKRVHPVRREGAAVRDDGAVCATLRSATWNMIRVRVSAGAVTLTAE